ncbi:MAG: radical SAM protein, partial [Desulfobulbus sp.]|nr:radical SAM protein [Desulfobulbus sp.]
LEFTRDLHPSHRQDGPVRAQDTIRFALTTHRGCYGECNFCAIAVHQGRTVQNRSIDSLVREATRLAGHPAFKGMIADVGGPTANMYGFECAKKQTLGPCRDRRCLFPEVCPVLKPNHGPLIELLRRLRAIAKIRKIAVASGLRHDLILADRAHGLTYLREIVRHHVSGQLKIAPEHSRAAVLAAMGKPSPEALLRFRSLFNRLTGEEGLAQYLTYYLIAAHPGCTQADMEELRAFCLRRLHLLPRQVQLFTPTPCTWSTLMYWTGINPFTGEACFVEKSESGRERQKAAITGTAQQRSARRPGKNPASSRKRPS